VLEVSLGDYVLSGGEVAALAIIEAVVRLLPGVVGNPESLLEESFGAELGRAVLEYPVYTKPAVWRGHAVPDVLLSGHHANVLRWRREAALGRTTQRRPDVGRDLSSSSPAPPSSADDPAAAD
jgi:tRNA (guanine37-N1)-methyltransferase